MVWGGNTIMISHLQLAKTVVAYRREVGSVTVERGTGKYLTSPRVDTYTKAP
jgi:hypothetical protein